MAQPILMSTKLDKHSATHKEHLFTFKSSKRLQNDGRVHTNSARRGVGCGGRAQLNNGLGLGESRDLAVFLFFSSSRTGMF